MFHKHLLASFLLAASVCATGCAADAGNDSKEESDALAIADESTSDESGVEIARLPEGSRGCSSSELGIAQQHATDNHTTYDSFPNASGVHVPKVTGCSVSNGWIIYTYIYP